MLVASVAEELPVQITSALRPITPVNIDISSTATDRVLVPIAAEMSSNTAATTKQVTDLKVQLTTHKQTNNPDALP